MDTKASIFGDDLSYVAIIYRIRTRKKQLKKDGTYELRNTPSIKFRVIMLADNDRFKIIRHGLC
jgi:hypothetical protein